MARRTASSTYSRPPRSRTVVTPASRVSCARRSALSAVRAAGSSLRTRTGSASAPRQRWTWQLMRPGRSVCPPRSMRRPRGACAVSTTRAMRPSSTTTARPRTGSAPVPSIRVAPTRINVSMELLDVEARVESIAEAVAEKIDAEDGDENGQAREGCEPPGRREVDAAVGQHSAPGRRGRLDAQGEEGQRGLDDDDPGHVQRGHHEPWREGIGQHVAEEDAAVAAPQRDGGLHELALTDGQHLAPHHARVDYPGRHADDDDDIAQARPQHADDGDGEQDKGKGELDVGQPHEEVIDLAAEIAGHEADGHAEHARDQHGREPDDQRHPRAVDDTRQDVTPQVILAQKVRLSRRVSPPGLLQALVDVLLDR